MEEEQKTIKMNMHEDKFYRKTAKSGYRNPKYDQFMRKVNRILIFFFSLFIGGLIFLCIGNAIGIPFIEEWILKYL